jgi:histidinol-phosphate aminotransferase
MISPVPKHIETLTPYVPGKPIEETEREYGITGAIKLASNENPLGPSPKAIKALSDALTKLHLYPDASSFYLKRKLADHLGVTPDELVLGSGSNEVIELLIRTFMGEEDEALLCKGSFVMYKVALHAHNRRFVEVPMKGYHYDLDAMAERIGPRTRMVFMANPDNPTGTWFGKGAFERFLDKARQANPDMLLVMDEAYFEYATAPDYPDSMKYRADHPNMVTLRTFSKIYGLAGLRLGYGVLDARLAGYMNRSRMPFNVTSLAQIGGMAALDDQGFVLETRELNAHGLEFVTGALRSAGLEVLPSQTNFVFVDFKRPAAPLYEAMLRRGIIVRPVPNYGFPTALRITIGTRAENERLLEVVHQVLKES